MASSVMTLTRCNVRLFLIVVAVSALRSVLGAYDADDGEFERDIILPTECAYDRGLVTTNVSAVSILAEHQRYCANTSTKRTPHYVLGYVTPWNSHGHVAARVFAGKLTHVSPTWFQIRLQSKDGNNKMAVHLDGKHNIDFGWLSAVRQANPRIRIVPRYVFEFTAEHLLQVPTNNKLRTAIINKITKSATHYKFDGAVMELTDAWAIVRTQKEHRIPQLNQFLIDLCDALHSLQPRRDCVLVVKPYFQRSPYYAYPDWKVTHDHVDLYSLMTYDFNVNYQRDAHGPNAPLEWIENSVFNLIGDDGMDSRSERHKVCVGLHFYGMKYPESGSAQSDSILGVDYIRFLKSSTNTTFEWIDEWREHRVTVNDGADDNIIRLYFPTLRSLADRIQLSIKLDVSISIWELGQSLPYFFDLF